MNHVGGKGSSFWHRTIDLVGDLQRLIVEVNRVGDGIHDFGMDMEVVGQDPIVGMGFRVPQRKHGLVEFPGCRSCFDHGFVEGGEEFSLTKDLLGHSGGTIEARHDRVLSIFMGDFG